MPSCAQAPKTILPEYGGGSGSSTKNENVVCEEIMEIGKADTTGVSCDRLQSELTLR